MKSLGLIVLLISSTFAFANRPLNCAPAVALQILSAMPAMGASMYAPGRYTFLRSTCGVAEQGLYCLGRDAEERLQDPVHQQLARSYQQGIAECGVPRDSSGRWQTGEIRCRRDAYVTCRIFPPAQVPANWPQTATPQAPGSPSAAGSNVANPECFRNTRCVPFNQATDYDATAHELRQRGTDCLAEAEALRARSGSRHACFRPLDSMGIAFFNKASLADSF
jgi:hypothetical protein